MTAAQSYDYLSTDTGFKFCHDYCGPNALVRMLTGVEEIHFLKSMATDVKRLEEALKVRISYYGMKPTATLPPGSDAGRKELDDADAKVRADLGLPAS